MKKYRKWLVTGFCVVLASTAYSADVLQSPHIVTGGIMTGILKDDAGNPLPSHPVVLEVYKGSELVLAIPKMTDEEGKYSFKNISPEFEYRIKAGGVTSGPASGPEPEPKPKSEPPAKAASKKKFGEFQLLAIILSITAVLYAVCQRKKAA